jgi:hypothetical protein
MTMRFLLTLLTFVLCFNISSPAIAQTSTNQQVTVAPATWGPTTLTLTGASQTQTMTLPGSSSLVMRVAGSCTDTNPAAIIFGNSPDVGGPVLGAARLFKSGVGSLGRNSLMCNGTISGGYRLVTGGSQISVSTSSTFSGSVTLTIFATQSSELVFINGPVHTSEEEALRAGRAWIVSTQLQSVASGNSIMATLSNPAGSGVNMFIVMRVFACNGTTGTTPQEWTTYANPTNTLTTQINLANRKPNDTTVFIGTFRWQMGTGSFTGGTAGDSGPVVTGGGYDAIPYLSMLTPGNTAAVTIAGAGGGLAATARCKITYLGYDEPIN